MLEKYLPDLDQKNQYFKFKLLEIFILLKTDIDKNEKFEELYEYQLSLSQKEDSGQDSFDIENTDIEKGNVFNDFNLSLLTINVLRGCSFHSSVTRKSIKFHPVFSK